MKRSWVDTTAAPIIRTIEAAYWRTTRKRRTKAPREPRENFPLRTSTGRNPESTKAGKRPERSPVRTVSRAAPAKRRPLPLKFMVREASRALLKRGRGAQARARAKGRATGGDRTG